MKLRQLSLYSVVVSAILLAGCSDKKMPKECSDYIDTVRACASKMTAQNPQLSETFNKSLDQAQEQWKNLDKKQLATSCKAASELFKEQAGAIGC